MDQQRQHKYTALVIDDDVWIQRILAKVLDRFGFSPVTASNGFDGIALAIELQPVIIFLDIMMPELSGHAVLKLLKRIKLTKDIPVLIITALSDTENLSMAIKEGAVGFVSKPFTRATIYEKLMAIFGSELLERISRHSKIPPPREMPLPQEEKKGTEIEQAEEASHPKAHPSQVPPHGLAVDKYKEESPTEEKQLEIIRKLLSQK